MLAVKWFWPSRFGILDRMSSDPTEQVTKATAALNRALKRADQRRAALHAEIVKARADGVRQKVIVRITGYSRERIRQIEKAARKSADAAKCPPG